MLLLLPRTSSTLLLLRECLEVVTLLPLWLMVWPLLVVVGMPPGIIVVTSLLVVIAVLRTLVMLVLLLAIRSLLIARL